MSGSAANARCRTPQDRRDLRLIGPYRGAAHPALVRAALETGGDVPAEAQRPDFRSMVHVAAAIGLRAQEVEADALTEAFVVVLWHDEGLEVVFSRCFIPESDVWSAVPGCARRPCFRW
ncbi:hypothetical protein [Streptomyces sp. NPDC001914]|uniref:hypothetical protein n=1 Tax=Streptomyces sp. NPDC001914 TaxID=3364623 RepID=UPI003685168E